MAVAEVEVGKMGVGQQRATVLLLASGTSGRRKILLVRISLQEILRHV